MFNSPGFVCLDTKQSRLVYDVNLKIVRVNTNEGG